MSRTVLRAGMWHLAALLAASTSTAVGRASAQPSRELAAPCGAGESVLVSVHFVGDAWAPAFEGRVLRELRDALREREIAVCDGREIGERPPSARIDLRTGALPTLEIAIEIADHVTEKRIARDLDIVPVPEDARAYAIAVACDELLRLSWVELALPDMRTPAIAPPPAITRIASDEVHRASTDHPTWIGLRAAAHVFSGGDVHLGGALFIGRRVHEMVALELSAGVARGLTRGSPNGTVDVLVIDGALDVLVDPIRVGVWSAGASAGVRAGYVTFEGHASAEDASGATGAGGAALVRAGLFTTLEVAPLLLRLGGSVELAIVGVAATDSLSSVRVSAIEGVGGLFHLGAGALF